MLVRSSLNRISPNPHSPSCEFRVYSKFLVIVIIATLAISLIWKRDCSLSRKFAITLIGSLSVLFTWTTLKLIKRTHQAFHHFPETSNPPRQLVRRDSELIQIITVPHQFETNVLIPQPNYQHLRHPQPKKQNDLVIAQQLESSIL